MVNLPEFKNTEDAIAFGKEYAGNFAVKSALFQKMHNNHYAADVLLTEYKKSKSPKVINKANICSFNAQLYRESIEAMVEAENNHGKCR